MTLRHDVMAKHGWIHTPAIYGGHSWTHPDPAFKGHEIYISPTGGSGARWVHRITDTPVTSSAGLGALDIYLGRLRNAGRPRTGMTKRQLIEALAPYPDDARLRIVDCEGQTEAMQVEAVQTVEDYRREIENADEIIHEMDLVEGEILLECVYKGRQP